MGVRRISRMDAASRKRIDAACGFINAEIQRYRTIWMWWLLAVTAVGVVTLMLRVDVRVIFGGAFVIMLFVYGWCERVLRKSYKGILLPRVVRAMGEGLSYSAESSFTKDDFVAMDMFSPHIDNFSSEDEIEGRTGEVTYSIHEIRATREEGSGKHRRTVTVFRGLMVRLDFNKNFAGHTVVVSNSESQILGGLFGESESRRGKTLARMENAEFENAFSVYATDDQQARYILTPKLMELILKTAANLQTAIRLGFVANSVFVAVRDSRNRFEASLFRTVTPDGALADFVEVMDLAESLVQTLDLETRIWSRV